MKSWVTIVALTCGSAAYAACGSCNDEGQGAVAPLQMEEVATLPALPKAHNPFTAQPGVTSEERPPLALPEDAPVLIRVASPKRFDEVLGSFNEARVALGSTEPGWRSESLIAKLLNIDPESWVAQDKPATLLFVHPARYLLGEVLILGIRDTEALLRQLPKDTFDEDEAPPEGHSAVYRSPTGNIYVDFVGPNVVFTKHDDVFALAKAFISGPLASWEADHDLNVIVDVDQIRSAFDKEIALTRDDPSPRGRRGSGVPFLSKQALLTLADGFKGLSLDVDVEKGHFKIATKATQLETPKGASAWLKDWLSALSGRTSVPLSGLPTGTWAAAGFSSALSSDVFNPTRASVSTEVNTLYGDLLDLTPAEREASAPLWERLVELVSGNAFAFAFEQGEVPACGALVVEMSDAHRGRFLIKRLLETFLLRIVPRIQDEEIPIADMPFPDGDFRSVSDLFKAINEVYQQVGITFYESALVEAGDDIAVEALGIRFDTAKRAEAAKAGKTTLGDIIGSQLEIALAYRGNLAALVLSPNASTQAALLVSGSFGKGKSPFSGFSPGKAAVAAFALDRLVVAVPNLWPKATTMTAAESLKGDTSIALEASANTLAMSLSLPINSVALVEALKSRDDEASDQTPSQKSTP